MTEVQNTEESMLKMLTWRHHGKKTSYTKKLFLNEKKKFS